MIGCLLLNSLLSLLHSLQFNLLRSLPMSLLNALTAGGQENIG